jgi:hypothetical protein
MMRNVREKEGKQNDHLKNIKSDRMMAAKGSTGNVGQNMAELEKQSESSQEEKLEFINCMIKQKDVKTVREAQGIFVGR